MLTLVGPKPLYSGDRAKITISGQCQRTHYMTEMQFQLFHHGDELIQHGKWQIDQSCIFSPNSFLTGTPHDFVVDLPKLTPNGYYTARISYLGYPAAEPGPPGWEIPLGCSLVKFFIDDSLNIYDLV